MNRRRRSLNAKNHTQITRWRAKHRRELEIADAAWNRIWCNCCPTHRHKFFRNPIGVADGCGRALWTLAKAATVLIGTGHGGRTDGIGQRSHWRAVCFWATGVRWHIGGLMMGVFRARHLCMSVNRQKRSKCDLGPDYDGNQQDRRDYLSRHWL